MVPGAVVGNQCLKVLNGTKTILDAGVTVFSIFGHLVTSVQLLSIIKVHVLGRSAPIPGNF